MANILSNHLKQVKAQMPIDKTTGKRVEYPVELLYLKKKDLVE